MNTPRCGLELRALRVQAHIGWTEAERRSPQPLKFDLKLRFGASPRACENDSLEDTLCYGRLSELITQTVGSARFKLIERLGFVVFTELKSHLPADARLWIRVTKESPPIPALQGGAHFVCGDEDFF